MTPKKKTANSTTLKMERKRILQKSAANGDGKVHVAGGSNAGIVVNKQQVGDQGKNPNVPSHFVPDWFSS